MLVLLCIVFAQARQYTISGFSSGGFFAHQMHVILSQNITGVGVVAGGPYYCTMGSYNRFQTSCKANSMLINLSISTQKATDLAGTSQIDPLENLNNSKVYIFSGKLDTVVYPAVVQETEFFYRYFVGNSSNVLTNYEVNSQHSWVTNDTGNPCWYLGPPGVNSCNFDLAGAILQHIIGPLSPPGIQNLSNIYGFSQSDYGNTWQAGMSNRGFAYIPENCLQSTCKVHLLFHGCEGSHEVNGMKFIEEIGVNQWAETNKIVVIYPQLTAHSNNPIGCWDFWGYTGNEFITKNSLQVSISNMMANNPPIVQW